MDPASSIQLYCELSTFDDVYLKKFPSEVDTQDALDWHRETICSDKATALEEGAKIGITPAIQEIEMVVRETFKNTSALTLDGVMDSQDRHGNDVATSLGMVGGRGGECLYVEVGMCHVLV